MPRAQSEDEPLEVCPFTVIVDTREQAPYRFTNQKTDDEKPLIVQTTRRTLRSGDYSIDWLDSRVAIERKSHSDYLGSIGGGRERFENEIERLSQFDFAAVVVEADWREILAGMPGESQISPRVAARTAFSWSIRYGVHFYFMPGREVAESATFRLLEMFWRQEQKRIKMLNKALAAI
jgi:ERCC4-type nuclease